MKNTYLRLCVVLLLLTLACPGVQALPINGVLWHPGGDNFCTAGGSTNAYTCAFSPALGAYLTGACYRFQANAANTGAATLNLNGLGAIAITKLAGGITTALVANDIRTNQVVNVCYDGTQLQMQSQLGNAPAGSGTVNSGVAGTLAYYPSTGTTVDDSTALQISATQLEGINHRISALAVSTTLDTTHGPVIACTPGASDRTMTLPAAATTKQTHWVMYKTDAGAGKCIFAPTSGERINATVNGTASADAQNAQVEVRLQSTGTPNWSAAAGVTLVSVPQGGLGVATLAAHGVLLGAGTSPVVVSGAGTTGQCFTSNGASADPTFQTCGGGGVALGDSPTWTGKHTFTPGAGTGTVAPTITLTPAANTALTASTERNEILINTSTQQWATGGLAAQNKIKIVGNTLSAVGASTFSEAATLSVSGPIKGTNVTLTQAEALLVPTWTCSTATTCLGAVVNAPTGATNNYAAAFLGGYVGIGTKAPLRKFHIAEESPNTNMGARLSTVSSGWSASFEMISGSQNWHFGTNLSRTEDDFEIRDETGGVSALYAVKGTGFLGIGNTAAPERLTVAGHIATSGPAPAVSSCGSSPTIVGTDTVGKVTVGSAPSASCTLTFNAAYVKEPSCHVTNETTPNFARAISTPTTVVFAGTMLGADVLAYTCLGRI